MNYKRLKIWSLGLRIFHWSFALSIVVLCLTGYYIHNPFALGVWTGVKTTFLMAKVRYVHFVAAYVFMAAVFFRLYLFFFGNRFERLADFLPLTPRNMERLRLTIRHYFYLTDGPIGHGGHNPLAGTVYTGIILLSLVMIMSGLFLLFPESHFWVSWGVALFGSQQMARLVHYFLFWLFLIFILVHVYLVIWNEIFGSEALISSIFSGYKFLPKDKESKPKEVDI